MKPKPVKQTSTAEYPSFRKFHITRQALVAGAAAATVAAVSGCVTKTSGVPACSEAPEVELSLNQNDITNSPPHRKLREEETRWITRTLSGLTAAPTPPDFDQ